MAVRRQSRNSSLTSLFVAAVALQCCAFVLRLSDAFVAPGAPGGLRGSVQQHLVARRSTAAAKDEPAKTATETKAVDDAVLKMAVALAEEEESGKAPATPAKVEEDEGFDFQKLLSVFWICIIIYSFGSAFIGIATGRLQDRSGGDFTLYDFFDNIFSFREWDLEYSLGFDPVKVFNQVTGKGGQ